MKKILQVGKAILTEEAVSTLENLQAENNFGIEAVREDLANAVCFIAKCLSHIGNDLNQEATGVMIALTQTRESISELKKP
jgi:hypothetical protein